MSNARLRAALHAAVDAFLDAMGEEDAAPAVPRTPARPTRRPAARSVPKPDVIPSDLAIEKARQIMRRKGAL